jgi:hypothetical protein
MIWNETRGPLNLNGSERYPGLKDMRVLLIRGSEGVGLATQTMKHPGGHKLRVEQHTSVSRQSCTWDLSRCDTL